MMQQFDPSLPSAFGALWLTVAILAGGFARTRNRSGLGWFALTFFLGPIAAFFLVVLRPVDAAPAAREEALSDTTSPDQG